MKIRNLAVAAALALGVLGAMPAAAQRDYGQDSREMRGGQRGDRGDNARDDNIRGGDVRGDRDFRRDDGRRYGARRAALRGDNGRHYGWERGRHNGWSNARRNCRTVWRHHQRQRVCYRGAWGR